MKVIIAGSRTITDYAEVVKAIEQSGYNITEIVSGGAKGVDTLGERYAEDHGLDCSVYIAQWKNLNADGALIKEGRFGKYNAKAGLDRNIEMAKYADALIAVYDGYSRGTKHMISVAKENNLEVFVYEIP